MYFNEINLCEFTNSQKIKSTIVKFNSMKNQFQKGMKKTG